MRTDDPHDIYDEDEVGMVACTHWSHADTQDLSDAAEQLGMSAVPLLYLAHNLEEQGIYLMKQKRT
jgi:hypothetical protein